MVPCRANRSAAAFPERTQIRRGSVPKADRPGRHRVLLLRDEVQPKHQATEPLERDYSVHRQGRGDDEPRGGPDGANGGRGRLGARSAPRASCGLGALGYKAGCTNLIPFFVRMLLYAGAWVCVLLCFKPGAPGGPTSARFVPPPKKPENLPLVYIWYTLF